jgi:hypothetical protein
LRRKSDGGSWNININRTFDASVGVRHGDKTISCRWNASKARQAEPAALTPLLNIGTCAVFLAFAGLWLIFFRNIAARPSELVFWHFHL